MRAELIRSPRAGKKWRAVFSDGEKKRSVDFGAAGMGDYTIYSKQDKEVAEAKKSAYLKRHRPTEDWTKYDSAGALSRWVLWNLPTVEASWRDYKRRFGLD